MQMVRGFIMNLWMINLLIIDIISKNFRTPLIDHQEQAIL